MTIKIGGNYHVLVACIFSTHLLYHVTKNRFQLVSYNSKIENLMDWVATVIGEMAEPL